MPTRMGIETMKRYDGPGGHILKSMCSKCRDRFIRHESDRLAEIALNDATEDYIRHEVMTRVEEMIEAGTNHDGSVRLTVTGS